MSTPSWETLPPGVRASLACFALDFGLSDENIVPTMAELRSFRAIHPASNPIARAAAIPYDITPEQAIKLARSDSKSFLHVIRAEVDVADSSEKAPEIYATAKENLEKFLLEGLFRQEGEPSLFVYRLRTEQHEQTGVAGLFSINEYEKDLIAKHEKTLLDKEDGTARRLQELGIQTGPISLAYRPDAAVSAAIEISQQRPPLIEFDTFNHVRHTIWKSTNAAELIKAFKAVPKLYLTDGHHRAAAASMVRAVLKDRNPAHDGREVYNYILGVAFPADELRILPFTRLVRDLGSLDAAALLKKLRVEHVVEPASHAPPAPGATLMFLGNQWWSIVPLAREENTTSLVDRLDVARLHKKILGSCLGIEDATRDPRLSFLAGSEDHRVVEAAVRNGEFAAAFCMHAVSADELMAVADSGGTMPPKSTWLEPKLCDGALLHRL